MTTESTLVKFRIHDSYPVMTKDVIKLAEKSIKLFYSLTFTKMVYILRRSLFGRVYIKTIFRTTLLAVIHFKKTF